MELNYKVIDVKMCHDVRELSMCMYVQGRVEVAMRMHLVFHLLDYTPLSCIGAIDPAKLDHRPCYMRVKSYELHHECI